MPFEFATATRILFGAGQISQAAPAAATMGRRALLVTGGNPQRAADLGQQLADHQMEHVTYCVTDEPTVDTVLEAVSLGRDAQCDVVMGLGGGSTIDTGKAVAALLNNPGDPMDYLEVVGQGRPLANAAAPYIAIPTTAGTGAEVTRNAVLGVPQHQVKVSLRSPLMLPRLAIVDPELTYSAPPAITASTGLDALTQLIEPFVSSGANPLTDGICQEGMRRAARSLRRVYHNGTDKAAREDMAIASLFGGLALANARLGAVHGIAGPFGGMFAAPHGAICAALLPHVLAANLQALQRRPEESAAMARFGQVARILTDSPDATAQDAVTWVQELCGELQIPTLRSYGLREMHFPALIEKAQQASSMKGNPVPLQEQELYDLLRRAL